MSEIDQAENDFSAEPITRLKSFAPTELVACEQCSRANAPTRASCLYCGAELPGAAVASAADKGEVTPLESVHHALFITDDQLSLITSEACSRLAILLDVGTNDLSNAMAAGGPLPLTTALSTAQTRPLIVAFQELGLRPSVLPEEALTRSHAKRIRGLELSENLIRALPPNTSADAFAWGDVKLMVVGRVVTMQIEVDEKRRGKESRPIDSRQFSSDKIVADVYVGSEQSWRISEDNFDYSCLGDKKAATGFENIGRLLELIRERAPHVEIDKSYASKRILLANVWPLEEDSKTTVMFGMRRMNRQSSMTSNESQFSKYSRAAWLLKSNRAEFTP